MLLAFAVHSAIPLIAQDSTKPASANAKVKGSRSAAAYPETDVLKQWVGDWDATIESTGRDGKPVTNAAKTTVTLLGKRWLITDFEGTFLGAPFIGHEVLGYDPLDKKYVLNWVDGMATWRQVDIWKDTDHHDWTLRVVSPKDGKEQIQMTIRYSRRKSL
jgi:Protein of unknown function (DUF1579)